MHHPTDTAFVKPVVEHWLEREIPYYVILFKHSLFYFVLYLLIKNKIIIIIIMVVVGIL